MGDEKWLTVEEISRYLQVTRDTVYKWINHLDMPAHKVGKRWMFQRAEVDAWIRDGKAADK